MTLKQLKRLMAVITKMQGFAGGGAELTGECSIFRIAKRAHHFSIFYRG